MRENSLVPVNMRSFTAIASIWPCLGFSVLASSRLGLRGPSKFEVRRISCYSSAGILKLGSEPPSLYCCSPWSQFPQPPLSSIKLPCLVLTHYRPIYYELVTCKQLYRILSHSTKTVWSGDTEKDIRVLEALQTCLMYHILC